MEGNYMGNEMEKIYENLLREKNSIIEVSKWLRK